MPPLQSLVKVDQHNDADLDRHARQGDEPDSDRDRHVVAQQVEQPEAANQRQRQCPHDDQHFREIAEIDIQQQHDYGECYRYHGGQAFPGANQVLVLAGPGHRVAGRQFHLIADGLLCLGNVGAKITSLYVDIDPAVQAGIFRLDQAGSVIDVHIGDLDQRYMRTAGRDDGQVAQFFQRVADVTRVADIDGIALQAFNSLTDIDAANSR